MSYAKNKLRWCLNKAQKELQEGKKHRGIVEIKSDIALAKEHITKADHNLKATFYLQEGGFTDWCSSTLFYTIYHCFLAILAKFGYESRNQECTFVVIASLVEDGKISLDISDLEKVSSMSDAMTQESPTSAISVREEYQYTPKVYLENNAYEQLLELAKRILDKTKTILET